MSTPLDCGAPRGWGVGHSAVVVQGKGAAAAAQLVSSVGAMAPMGEVVGRHGGGDHPT